MISNKHQWNLIILLSTSFSYRPMSFKVWRRASVLRAYLTCLSTTYMQLFTFFLLVTSLLGEFYFSWKKSNYFEFTFREVSKFTYLRYKAVSNTLKSYSAPCPFSEKWAKILISRIYYWCINWKCNFLLLQNGYIKRCISREVTLCMLWISYIFCSTECFFISENYKDMSKFPGVVLKYSSSSGYIRKIWCIKIICITRRCFNLKITVTIKIFKKMKYPILQLVPFLEL